MKNTEFIYGIHPLTTILEQEPQRITCLYMQNDRVDHRVQSILQQAQQLGLKIQKVTKSELDRLVHDARHQGVVAACIVQAAPTEDSLFSLLEKLTEPPLLLILDSIQDPHNLGACLRTADAMGVHAVITPRDRSVGLTPTVHKVACGAAATMPFIQVTNLARTLRKLKDAGVWLYGFDEDGAAPLHKVDLRGGVGLIMGAEGEGLRRLTREHCDEMLVIPMRGHVPSLNVSVAAALAMYEVRRQRH